MLRRSVTNVACWTEVKVTAERDRELLVKAARMYFVDGASQQDVAKALGTSRSNMSRMLSAARQQGIVEIRIVNSAQRRNDLEGELKQRFGLHDCRVPAYAPGPPRLSRWPSCRLSGSSTTCRKASDWRSRGVPHCRPWSRISPPASTTTSRWSNWLAACRRCAPRLPARSWSVSWPPVSARATDICTPPRWWPTRVRSRRSSASVRYPAHWTPRSRPTSRSSGLAPTRDSS